MAIRIIKVDRATEDHWDYAKRNGFWDMPKRFQLEYGDTVLFWRGGSPGMVLGQAKVAGNLETLGPETPHAWSPHDRRRGRYKHRVALADFIELPHVEVTYGEFGFSGQNPVFEVSPTAARELVRRVGVRVSVADLAFDQLTDALEAGAEEPHRYDEDHRVRVPASVVFRRGASKFRAALMRAYRAECAVTGTSIPGVLDAAHISPYKGDHTDRVSNGLLLRTDIHTLFDLHLLTVLPDLTIRIAPDARTEPYLNYDRTKLTPPARRPHHPDPGVLTSHNGECAWLASDPRTDDVLF